MPDDDRERQRPSVVDSKEIFISRHSVATAHLPLERVDYMSDREQSWSTGIEKRSVSTGHLPRAPQDDGAGASVPTGHLPTDVPAAKPSEDKK
ncbi:MAG: hypothetical protein EOP06_28345 [Proteobacteria bacterium]|nr:MAG: hypothetical protein EOP06_28345 [Pseudomonadota bacterium]